MNEVSNLLPPPARDLLVKAASFPVPRRLEFLTPTEELLRKQALEDAIERVRFSYPKFFKEEQ